MRSPRFHAALSALPLALWLAFHLWEQWAAFAGRDAWMARMSATSRGPLAIGLELAIVVVPLALWGALTLRALLRREALPGRASPDGRGAARVVGRLAPGAAVVALLFLAAHVGTFWLPKLVRGDDLAAQWIAITHLLGRPELLVIHAIGLSAIALHLAAAIPAALEALGWIDPGARRSTLLVASTYALCGWVLAAQLVGWLGTGTGTFWPVEVVETAESSEDSDSQR